MTEAERAYEAVCGAKPDSETAVAVGLVWAIERADNLLGKVKAAKEESATIQDIGSVGCPECISRELGGRIAELEAALRPFADAANAFPDASPDSEITNWHPSGLTFGHLYAAARTCGITR